MIFRGQKWGNYDFGPNSVYVLPKFYVNRCYRFCRLVCVVKTVNSYKNKWVHGLHVACTYYTCNFNGNCNSQTKFRKILKKKTKKNEKQETLNTM